MFEQHQQTTEQAPAPTPLHTEVDLPLPRVYVDPQAEDNYQLLPDELSRTMSIMGVSDEYIPQTTFLVDGHDRHMIHGMTAPGPRARKYFGRLPWVDEVGDGAFVLLATKHKGKQLPVEKINEVLVHEVAHVAQLERGDTWLKLNRYIVAASTLAGAVAGNRVGKGTGLFRAVTTMKGFDIGFMVGYGMLAPSERQARAASRTIISTAVRTKRQSEKSDVTGSGSYLDILSS
jgi:hypothetical protein